MKPKANNIILPNNQFGSPPVAIQMQGEPQPNPPITFFIYDDIGDPEHYIDFISMLNQATESDTFIIRLNTVGGSLWTCVALVNAIQGTKAHTIGVAEGLVASAGTFILFSCREIVFSEYSICMMHDGSNSGEGSSKFSESKKSLNAISMLYERLAKDIYVDLFTEEEIAKILNGEDFWCLYDDMRERYNSVVEKYQEQEDEEPTSQPVLLTE